MIYGEKVNFSNLPEGKVWQDYLGRKVLYTPDNEKTIDFGSGIVDSGITYRLFFVDVNGKFGNIGSVYLKADCDTRSRALYAIPPYSFISSEADDTDPFSTLKALNPEWAQKMKEDSSLVPNMSNQREKSIAKLLDPALWVDWKDNTHFKSGEIRYVVGSPSIEMYIDSYNEYLKKNTNLKTPATGNPQRKRINLYICKKRR